MNRARSVIALGAAITVVGGLATVASATDHTKFYSTMSGTQERPAGDPDGTGTAALTFTSRRVCYLIRPRRAGLRLAAGHLHVGARRQNGDVLIPLFTAPKRVDRGRLTGCSPRVPAADLRRIRTRPARHYLNLHNETYPAGAIRGQLSANRPR